MSTGVFGVSAVRAAEERLLQETREGELMRRAATGLAGVVATTLAAVRGRVNGARVVLLIGSGNNGGDALWAGAGLARRGADIQAITLAEQWHVAGMAALRASGGRVIALDDLDDDRGWRLIEGADAIVDGITGIGGRGPLRGRAADVASWCAASDAVVIAVDVPSGVDAETGFVADPDACIDADITVTFGCVKPGLVVAPGRHFAGGLRLIDIGLASHLGEARCEVLDELDLAEALCEPAPNDYKYSRGVVCIAAGSQAYRGAAYLAVDGARSGGVGMVRYLGRDRGLVEDIASTFWDVVVTDTVDDSRVSGYGIGPGWGTDSSAAAVLQDVLESEVPVVVDADALRLDAASTQVVRDRAERGLVSVLTPHDGEFAALGFRPGEDRLAAARAAAAHLGCVVVCKGPGTVIAEPSGHAYVDVFGTAELGTAGSGDVLTGVMAAMLASAHARTGGMTMLHAARIAAAAVGVHGLAGRAAGRSGRPVTARGIAAALPDAIAKVRRG